MIKEALEALRAIALSADLSVTNGERADVIHDALEAALQETNDWDAIEVWHEKSERPEALVVTLTGPFHKNADGAFYYCHLPGGRSFKGDTRAEALHKAAEWCGI